MNFEALVVNLYKSLDLFDVMVSLKIDNWLSDLPGKLAIFISFKSLFVI